MGSGAVGGYFGGLLHKGGLEVTLVARGAHRDAILRDGLRVESVTSGDFVVHPPAVERPDGSWKADLALLCVKSYHNAEAIRTMEPAIGEGTSVLTLQNGLGSGDELAAAFGRDKVLLGAAYIEASRKAPGVIYEGGGPCRIVFGEEDGSESAKAIAVRDAIASAGIDVELSTDVAAALWNKLLFICALSGMSCVARATMVEVLASPGTKELARRAIVEAEGVARALGVDLAEDVVESTMSYLVEHQASLTSSMYLDLQRGSRLELDVLNGAVSRLSKEVGVPTPVNDFVTDCLRVYDDRVKAGAG